MSVPVEIPWSESKYSKPMALIKAEIDQISQARQLESMTLLGGEPTLHPELPEIIRYISQKGILPALLLSRNRYTC